MEYPIIRSELEWETYIKKWEKWGKYHYLGHPESYPAVVIESEEYDWTIHHLVLEI